MATTPFVTTPRNKVTVAMVKDALNPRNGLELHHFDDGITPNQVISRFHPSGKFPTATACGKNGRPLRMAKWDEPLKAGEVIYFIPVPGDPVTIIIWLVVIIVALVVALAVSVNQNPSADTNIGETPEAEPVYDARGQTNQTKIGNPIESIYGRVRHWPSYGAAAYNKYVENDSYLHQLFCLGQGRIQIEQIYVEDTPIEQYDNIEMQLMQPGERLTLFADNVYTNSEVSSIELFGSNQPAYTGATAGFVSCPPFTRTTSIEIDFVLPAGLYFQSAGNLVNRTVVVDTQVRKIDDTGFPANDWATVNTFTQTMNTVTPQRFTTSIPVESGRYEVRCVRTNAAELDFKGKDQVIWKALRAVLTNTLVYGNVTMLAVRSKATNNLNDSAANRINFIATRLLPVWDKNAQIWINDVATRSPIWAFIDVFRSLYGGRLPDKFLALDDLADLATQLDAEAIQFDWIFDRKMTTWVAAQAVCKVCRSVPILRGSKITMVREVTKTVPVAQFNEANIIKSSFNYQLKLRTPEDHDGILVEYWNPNTWQKETVLCLAPPIGDFTGDAGNSPMTVTLSGCTDRTRAYREGMYMRLSEIMLRMNIKFKTGMEGLCLAYGDLILISHTLPRWGMGGFLKDISADGLTLTLSNEVEFGVGDYFVMLRMKNGTPYGPIQCSQYQSNTGIVDTKKVVLAEPIDLTKFYISNAEPATFLFGTGSGDAVFGKLATVASLTPSDGEDVDVTALAYDEGIFAYDDAEAPVESEGYFIERPPVLQTVKNLQVFAHPTSTEIVVASWLPIAGVQRYVVETSYDGITYQQINGSSETSNAYYTISVVAGALWVRVWPSLVGGGVPAVWSGNVGIAIAAPNNVAGLAAGSVDGVSIGISWTAVTTGAPIDGYVVRVMSRIIGGAYKLARQERTTNTAYSYTADMAVADNVVGREMRLLVTAVNIVAESPTPASIDVVNSLPNQPTDLNQVSAATTGNSRTWRLTWSSIDSDVRRFTVWASTVNNFNPSDATIVYQGLQATFDFKIPGTFDTAHQSVTSARYEWYVGVQDKWGEEMIVSEKGVMPFIDGAAGGRYR